MIRPQIKAILRAVAEECIIPVDCIVGPYRWPDYIRARHICAHASHAFGYRLQRISETLNRHHSTVIYILRKDSSDLEPELSRVIERLNRTRVAT